MLKISCHHRDHIQHVHSQVAIARDSDLLLGLVLGDAFG